MLGCPTFTFKKTTRDLTCSVHALFYINSQWKKINAFTRLITANHSCQNNSIAITYKHSTTSLLSYTPGLDAHDAAADNGFLTVNHISSDYGTQLDVLI